MQTLMHFDGQNWLITPTALAVGEAPPTTIRDQKWLVSLTGVIDANFEGTSTSQWRNDTVSFLPDMALDQHGNSAGPLAYAISHYGIPTPPPGQFDIGFTLEQWAPYVSLSAIYDQAQSIDAGYAVNVWRPNHFDTRTDFCEFSVKVRKSGECALLCSQPQCKGRKLARTPDELVPASFSNGAAGHCPKP